MGRSGGGGGGHSGGGFGGGHSSGGFSGGGRSGGFGGGGFSPGGSSSGGSSPFGGGYIHRPYSRGGGMGGGMGGVPGGSGRGCGGGCFTSLLVGVVIFLIFAWAIGSTMLGGGSDSGDVPANTTERTALSGVVDKTDWYEDQIGWISSRNVLVQGLEEFYKETGIQPYVLFVPYEEDMWNGEVLDATEADAYLEEYYADHFTDEAHFIFAYFSCEYDSRSEMDGDFRYLSGYTADTIMDSEAISILWGYFEKNYYDTSLTAEEMIANTFEETAESIMSKPTNGWDFARVAIIIIGVIAVALVLFALYKKKAQRDKEKEQYTKDILEKPLEKFGEDTSDLEDKYK